MKYGQVYDGDRVEPTPMIGHKMKCCDCGLVHVIDFYIVGKKVQFVSRRDKRATAAARREMRKARPELPPPPDAGVIIDRKEDAKWRRDHGEPPDLPDTIIRLGGTPRRPDPLLAWLKRLARSLGKWKAKQ